MNIIELMRDILTKCDAVETFTNGVHIDFTDPNYTNFGLSSNGDVLDKEDVLGNQTRTHSFVLYAVNQSFMDYDRLANSTFLLDLAYYLEDLDLSKLELKTGEKAADMLKIKTANGMMYGLMNPMDPNDGYMYQIQIYATYKKYI